MSLSPLAKENLGQLFIIGLQGLSLTADEKKYIEQNNIGGIVLFTRNYKDPEQLFNLCREIQALHRPGGCTSKLFISVDMEGGRVARFRAPFTEWPPQATLGELDLPSISFAFSHALGSELAAAGINLDFAPCLDIFNNPKNTVIGNRAVGTSAEVVGKHASALVRGFIKSGVIPCGKHFPGHGNTLIDSHLDLPIEEATLERLNNAELVPFKKAFKSHLDLVMTAHIKFPNIDPHHPGTFSKTILKDILRDQLRYRGIVITDDLDMGALANYYSVADIPVKALAAGCDILLYCNKPESHMAALESVKKALIDGTLASKEIEEKITAIAEFKKKNLRTTELATYAEAAKIIGNEDHRALSKAITEKIIPSGMGIQAM